MGDFITNPVPPVLFTDKAPGPNVNRPAGWTDANTLKAVEANALRDASLDIRAVLRPLVYTDAGALPVVATGATAARTAAQRAADTINVKDHGAKGDGATNDTAAFDAAFAAAAAAGAARTIFIPRGTYLVDSRFSGTALTLPAGCILRGEGDDSCLKIRPGSVVGNGGWYFILFNSHCRLRDFRVDGSADTINRSGMTQSDMHILHAHRSNAVTDVLVENVAVHNVHGVNAESFGIMTQPGNTDITFRNCRGWSIEGTAFHVTGNIATAGDWTTGPLVDGVKVLDCEAYSCSWMGLSVYGAKNVRISGGRFYNNTQHGLNFEWTLNTEAHLSECFGNGRAGVGTYGKANIRLRACNIHDNNLTADPANAEIRLLASGWYTGSPPPFGHAGIIEIIDCIVSPVAGSQHLLYDKNTSVNMGYSTPDGIKMRQPDASSWRIRIFGTDSTKYFAGVTHPALSGTPVYVGTLADLALDAAMSRAAYAGAGNRNANAKTFTSTAQFARASGLSFAFRSGRNYLIRSRARIEDLTGWNLYVENSGGAQKSIFARFQGYVAADVGRWIEHDHILKVPAGVEMILRLISLDAVASASITLDYLDVYELPSDELQRDSSLMRAIQGSATWNPPSVANAASTNTTVTVTGAKLGDPAEAAFSIAVPAGCYLGASVTAADTVTVTLFNLSGAAVDLASGTLRAYVKQH